MTDKKTVCIHEAGHAVAALKLGTYVDYIDCILEWKASIGKSYDDNNRIVIASAGVVAEALFERNFQGIFNIDLVYGKPSGTLDFGKISEIRQETDAFALNIEEACEKAWNLLKQNQKCLQQLANKLERELYLTKIDVERIVLKKRFPLWVRISNALDRRKQKKRLTLMTKA